MNNFLVKTSGLPLDNNEDNNNRVKTLMLMHGWGMNSQVWQPIRNALEAQYHLIWVDLPGHGFNRKIKAQSLDNIVALIATAASDLSLHNVHLVAWSLGGLVAQRLVQIIPEKISSMTMVSSTPRFSQDLVSAEKWQNAVSDEVLNRFANNLKEDTEKTLKGFIALQFIGVKESKLMQHELINHVLYPQKSISANKELSRKWGGVLINDSAQQNEENPNQQNNIPTLEALDVGLDILKRADLRDTKPTCLQHWIFAEYDRLIPKEVINDLISLRPDAEITLLEKAGHAPFISHPEAFLKHTLDFIEAIE